MERKSLYFGDCDYCLDSSVRYDRGESGENERSPEKEVSKQNEPQCTQE